MSEDKSILILIVNYHNDKDVIRYVTEEVMHQSYKNIRVVIVNNGSNNPTALIKMSEKFDNVFVVSPGSNLGYFGGMNYALRYNDVRHTHADIVIVSNSDLYFTDKNLFQNISRFDFTRGDVIGPDIRTEDGYPQNPMYAERISASKLRLLKSVFRFYPSYLVYQLASIVKKRKPMDSLAGGNTYAIQGAFMIFNNSYFQKGGDLNYGSFLYGEEIYIAETAREKNIRIFFEPSLHVIHRGNATTGRFKSGLHLKYFVKSYDYLLKRFFAHGK
jgi:GT2 family glycosyltransferase